MKKELEELVLNNMALAYNITSTYYHKVQSVYEYEDAQQVSLEGLIRAANTFDNTMGVNFSTYAYRVIKNHLFRKSILEAQKRKNLDISFISLDTLIGDDEATSLVDITPDNYDLEEELLKQEEVETLYRHINSLKPKHRDLILLRMQGKTFEEIGDILQLAPRYVWIVYKKVINILRDKYRVEKIQGENQDYE